MAGSYFPCTENEFIRIELVNDSIPDCSSGQDESALYHERQNQFHSENSCVDDKLIPCFVGDKRCYNVTQLCIYDLHKFGPGYLKYCRNGRHLANCTWFDCPSLFKCSGYYCIPWALVCDGKYDCPYGEDEQQSCSNRSCTFLFKCKNSSCCLHYTSVCNDEIECPLQDDEILCDLPPCPWKCKCLLYAMTCDNHLKRFRQTCFTVGMSQMYIPPPSCFILSSHLTL